MGNRKNNFKMDRIDSEIKKELQELLTNEVKDPRIECFLSVSEVLVSKDLSYCKVFVEVPVDTNADAKNNILKGLKNAAGFMRSELAKRINLRKTPELHFEIDDTNDKVSRLDELLKELHNKGQI